jgi:cytohesin
MRDVQGASALHMASQEGWKESISLLLESGADVDSQDIEGRVPLHYASRYLRKDCLDLLKSYGANETLRDLRGSLPRDYLAVEEKKFESKKAQDALRRGRGGFRRGGLGRGRS